MHRPSCGSMHRKSYTSPNNRWVRLLTISLVGALALASQAHATWNANGNAIVNLLSTQTANNVVTAPDGAGGVYVAWDDNRAGFHRDVFVTRLTSTGTVATGWPADGLDVSPRLDDQVRPRLLLDTSGGLYLCWHGHEPDGQHAYLQHLTSSGIPAAGWSSSEKNLGLGDTPDLTTDAGTIGGGAGVLVAYNLAGSPNAVLAFRFRFDGVGMSSGTVTTNSAALTSIAITSIGNANAIVSYAVSSDPPRVFVHRFSATGPVTNLWGPITVTSSTNASVAPSLASDGQSGAVLAFVDHFNGTAGGVSMARYNSAGTRLWFASPVLDSWAQGNDVPQVASDGAGGALALWADNRTPGHTDAYAAHVNSAGLPFGVWPASGEVVQTDILTGSTRLISDGAGGAVAAWAPSAAPDVFARRVLGSGDLRPVLTLSNDASSTQEQPSIALTATGASGAVIGAWLDSRTGGQPKDGVYANRVSIAEPAPRNGATSIYDPLSQRFIVFGGTTSATDTENRQVWSLSTTPGQAPVWNTLTQVLAPGTPPGRRPDPGFHYASVYDSRRQRMLIYGGCTQEPFPFGWLVNTVANNLFVLQLSTADPGTVTWLPVTQSSQTPPIRMLTSAVYDSLSDRYIFFGGVQGSPGAPVILGDCWQLQVQVQPGGSELYVWTKITAPGTAPSARHGHAAFVDRRFNQMIVVGGYPDSENSVTILNIWALSLGATPQWTQSPVFGLSPKKRTMFGSAYDRPFNRNFIFDGIVYNGGTGTCSLSKLQDQYEVWGLYSNSDGSFGWGSEFFSPRSGLHGDYAEATAWAASTDQILAFGGGYFQDCNGICDLNSITAMGGTHLLAVPDAGIPSQWSSPYPNTVTPAPCQNLLMAETPDDGATSDGPGTLRLQAIPTDAGVKLRMSLPKAGEIQLDVMDIQGRVVTSLSGGYRPQGTFEVSWDYRNVRGVRVGHSIYFARLRSAAGTTSVRLVAF